MMYLALKIHQLFTMDECTGVLSYAMHQVRCSTREGTRSSVPRFNCSEASGVATDKPSHNGSLSSLGHQPRDISGPVVNCRHESRLAQLYPKETGIFIEACYCSPSSFQKRSSFNFHPEGRSRRLMSSIMPG